MSETIEAACEGCGRNFSFHPNHVKTACMFCGAALSLPGDLEAPSPPRGPVRMGCPICGRAKDVDAGSPGASKPCWFCSCQLFIPEEDGPGLLVEKEEPPLQTREPLEALRTLDCPAGPLLADVLDRAFEAGRLGDPSTRYAVSRLSMLDRTPIPPGGTRSPLDAQVTAEVLWTRLFGAHSAVVTEHGPGLIHVSMELDTSQKGLGAFGKAALSTGLGMAALAATGVGWVSGPNSEDDEPEMVSLFLNASLQETDRGTLLTYELCDSRGASFDAEKILDRKFQEAFPGRFRKAATGLLLFKALYGMATPGRLVSYLTSEGLAWQIHRLTDNAGLADSHTGNLLSWMKA